MGVIVKDKLRWNFPRKEPKGLGTGLNGMELSCLACNFTPKTHLVIPAEANGSTVRRLD
jgi:hypothetical protein